MLILLWASEFVNGSLCLRQEMCTQGRSGYGFHVDVICARMTPMTAHKHLARARERWRLQWRRCCAELACVLLLSGCRLGAVPLQPTNVPTATPLPTSTPIPGLVLDQAYLASAAADIITAVKQGTADINNKASSCTPDRFGLGYLDEGWHRQATLDDLSTDPVLTLQFLVSLGAFREKQGAFYPALQDGEVIFATLQGLALPRITLATVPSAASQAATEVWPRGLVVRPGAELTILGLAPFDHNPGEASPRALVAVNDPERQGWLARRHFLVWLPLGADQPVAEQGLALSTLLALNGGQLDVAREMVTIPQDGTNVCLALNRIEGDELRAALIRAAGLAFVDELAGQRLDEPVIPYPPGVPISQAWLLSPVDPNDPSTLALRSAADGTVLAVAHYDRSALAWVWSSAPDIDHQTAP